MTPEAANHGVRSSSADRPPDSFGPADEHDGVRSTDRPPDSFGPADEHDGVRITDRPPDSFGPADESLLQSDDAAETTTKSSFQPKNLRPRVFQYLALGCFALLAAILVAKELLQWHAALWSLHPLLSYGFWFTAGVLFLSLAALGRRRTYQYLRLRTATRLRRQLATISAQSVETPALGEADAAKVRRAIRGHVEYLRKIEVVSDEQREELRDRFQETDDIEHWVEALREDMLLRMDERVAQVIEDEARAVAIFTAMSPSETVDSLLVFWRNSRMILRIAREYGVRPGWLGSLGLVRRVLAQVATAAVTQASLNMLHLAYGPKIAQAMGSMLGLLGKGLRGAGALVTLTAPHFGAPLVVAGHAVEAAAEKGGEVLEVISGPMLDGLLMAVLTVRVGLATQIECRLLPMTPEDVEKTAGIVGTVRGFLGKEIRSEHDDDDPERTMDVGNADR